MRNVILASLGLLAVAGAASYYFFFGDDNTEPVPVVNTVSHRPRAAVITGIDERDAQTIRKDCTEFIASIQKRQGGQAISYLDPASLKYLDGLKNAALTMPKQELLKADPFNIYLVLRIRQNADAAQLNQMNSPAAFPIWFINQGFLQNDSWGALSVGAVKLEGSKVKAQLWVSGKPTSGALVFSKQGNDWKIDISSLFNLVNKTLLQYGNAPEQAVTTLFEGTTGAHLSDDLWTPRAELTQSAATK